MSWTWGNIDWPQTLTAAVGASTIVQAAVATVMMRGLEYARKAATAADDTLRLSERTSERQLRAYLDGPPVSLKAFTVGGPLEAYVECKNTGQTPARKVRLAADLVLCRPEEVEIVPLPGDGPDQPETSVGAGARVTSFASMPWAHWEPNRQALMSGQLVMVVVGWCTYEDVFEKARRTEFRRVRPYTAPTAYFQSAPSGNTAT